MRTPLFFGLSNTLPISKSTELKNITEMLMHIKRQEMKKQKQKRITKTEKSYREEMQRHYERGVRDGKDQIRHQLRDLLGIDEDSIYDNIRERLDDV